MLQPYFVAFVEISEILALFLLEKQDENFQTFFKKTSVAIAHFFFQFNQETQSNTSIAQRRTFRFHSDATMHASH